MLFPGRLAGVGVAGVAGEDRHRALLRERELRDRHCRATARSPARQGLCPGCTIPICIDYLKVYSSLGKRIECEDPNNHKPVKSEHTLYRHNWLSVR